MTRVPRDKTGLFLSDTGDPLAGEFALAIAREFVGRATNLSFFYAGVDGHSSTDWCVAWVRGDNGQVQAWVGNIPAGPDPCRGAAPDERSEATWLVHRERAQL